MVSQCSRIIGLHRIVFCFGGRRLLPRVGLGLGGEPQPPGHVRRRGRLRAVAVEDAGLELIVAHGTDLSLLIGDLQSVEGVALQGSELGFGMRAEAHPACCGSVIPRASR